jgi:transcriptional regulator with XRE-family HTH domain
MSLGSKLKALRIERNESLQDVADAVKASKAHIWDIERGASRNPTMDLLDKLATHFGVSVGLLVGEEPPTEMHNELVALYRDLKNLSGSDRDTIRDLAKRLGEKNPVNNRCPSHALI